jgi:hypothetical protein
MKPGAFTFSSQRWISTIKSLGETGMVYVVVSVTLKDGRKFNQVVIDSGILARIRGLSNVPFAEDDIADISATHERWDWNDL